MSNQGTRGGHSSSFGGQNDHVSAISRFSEPADNGSLTIWWQLNRDRPFGRSQDGHNKRPRSPSGLEQDGPGKQRRQTNTQEPEFFGLFRGADNCFAGLGTMETLYKTLDGEWSEEMKRCVPFRVYQSVGALDNVRLFERYIAVSCG